MDGLPETPNSRPLFAHGDGGLLEENAHSGPVFWCRWCSAPTKGSPGALPFEARPRFDSKRWSLALGPPAPVRLPYATGPLGIEGLGR